MKRGSRPSRFHRRTKGNEYRIPVSLRLRIQQRCDERCWEYPWERCVLNVIYLLTPEHSVPNVLQSKMLSGLLKGGMAFFFCECSHPRAKALSRSLLFVSGLFVFGLFLRRRGFCFLRSPRCGARLADPLFRLFPWSSRCHAFGRSSRPTHFSFAFGLFLRRRRFC